MRRFIDVVAESGVDTYLQNINSQVPWYPSRRTPIILTGYRRGNREFFRKHFRAGLPKERLDPALDEQVVFLNRYLDLIVEDHDYEGLELDWLRCPFCIDPPATQVSIDTMTHWIAEIREMTNARAKATGKPYLLGLRLPCRLGMLKAIGLDIPAIVRSGLVDFVSFSNFFQTSWAEPLDDLRAELSDQVAI